MSHAQILGKADLELMIGTVQRGQHKQRGTVKQAWDKAQRMHHILHICLPNLLDVVGEIAGSFFFTLTLLKILVATGAVTCDGTGANTFVQ